MADLPQVLRAQNALYGGTTSATVAMNLTVNAGDLIVVFVQVNAIGATINTPTDSAGNTYNPIDSTNGTNSTTKGFYSWNSAARAANSVTCTIGAALFGSLSVIHCTGIQSSSSPLDKHVGNAQTAVATTADAITSTAVTPTTDGQLILGHTTEDTVEAITANAGTGFSILQAPNDSGESAADEYKIQGTAASIAATFTAGTASKNWVTQIATFKSANNAAGSDFKFAPFRKA